MKSCIRKRIENAIRRHHITILSPSKPDQPVILQCPICFESDTSSFVWKFISRRVNTPIFLESKKFMYESQWVLNYKEMKDINKSSMDNTCVYPISNNLYMDITNDIKQIGTYVCVNTKMKTHPANFIWYHVDLFDSKGIDLGVGNITFLTGIPNRVDKLEQVKTIQNRVRQKLESHRVSKDQVSGPFVMTSIVTTEDAHLDRCGLLSVRQEQRCYIKLPVTKPKIFHEEFHRFLYKSIREAFGFLVSSRNSEGLVQGDRFHDARMRANHLGFQLSDNDSFFYIPCDFSLFRHFFQFPPVFHEFPRPSYYVNVKFDVICPQKTVSDLLEIQAISELRNLTFNLPDIKDFRYIKIERLVMQGERDLNLLCQSKGDHPFKCDGIAKDDVLWRSGNGLTFSTTRMLNANVYVNTDCSLHFDEFHLYDVDIYYCFLRDPIETHLVWSNQPRMAYRLHMERKKFDWPNRNDVIVGLMILAVLTVLLTIQWAILHFYDASVREGAAFAATVKNAGGRLAQIKETYSPFSEEDRRLLFMVLENESLLRKS